MGISFLEGLGYVAQGAAEKSEQLRQEKLAARMEEMKENRALYREIAKTRYATDLSTYQEEAKKVGKIQSVLANISKNNVHIDQATMDLIKADDKTYAAYLATDAKDQGTFAKNFQDTYFNKTYADDGTTVTGYSVNYPTLGLNMPKESDYFKGAEFWTKYAEEIESKTKGPLTEQVNKLLGREPNAENQVKLDMDVKGTNVYGEFDNQSYSSNNTGESNLLSSSSRTFAYDVEDAEEKIIFNSITKTFETMTSPSNKDKTVARYLVAKGGEYTTDNDGRVQVTGDGANYFLDASNLYEEFANKIETSIKTTGNVLSKQHDKFANPQTVNKLFEQSLENRTIKLKNTTILGGGDIDSNYIIPTGIPGAGLQLGQMGENGPIVPVFLNNNKELLKRIEDRVNNDTLFKSFDGTASQGKELINNIIADEIRIMQEEGLLGGTVESDDGTSGPTSKGTITSMSQINALMQEEQNKGMTSAEIIQGLKEDGYDVSAVEKIKDVGGDASVAEEVTFEQGQPEVIFDVTQVPPQIIPGAGKSVTRNPAYEEYWQNLSEEDVANFYKAYEKLQSMKPEQFLPKQKGKRMKPRNPEYTKWLERIEPYQDWLETYENFQLKG